MHPAAVSILIIEDHVQTSRIMARLVTARGFHVQLAASLAEAEKCVKQGVIGFVISDLGLPDGNACAFMARLRDEHGLKGAAVSGYGMEGDIARSRDAGFVTHLTKPIRITELDEVLLLARHEIDVRSGGPPSSPRPE
jgi:CheY-like chemotaxis protein